MAVGSVADMETDDQILGDEPVYERAQDFADHLDEFIESVDELDPAAAWEWAPLHRVTANLVINALSDLLLRLDGLESPSSSN